MRFIDSNIIAYAFYENDKRKQCQTLIKEGGIINTVNLIEAYNIIQYETNQEYATKVILSLLKSHLKIISVDINLIFKTLRRTTKYKKLRFIDRLHYTTAQQENCTEIASFDTDFDNVDIKRVT